MTSPSQHPRESLHDLVSGELTADQAERVRAHVSTCAECAAELTLLSGARRAVSQRRDSIEWPAAMQDRTRRALREPPSAPASSWRLFTAIAAAAVFLIAVALVVRSNRTPPDPWLESESARAQVTLKDITSPTLVPADQREAERWLVERGAAQPVRVIDLAAMGWQLAGISVVDGRALYWYRGSDGAEMLCQMYRGALQAVPVSADTRREKGFEFRIFQRQDLTLVYWQEGDQICVLASRLDRESLFQLAVAKAMAR